jgi:hypothetical protein
MSIAFFNSMENLGGLTLYVKAAAYHKPTILMCVC